MALTCAGLVLHHLFAIWNGDRRWLAKHGDAFLQLKARTSVLPFLAIVQGRQKILWQEFLKPAYLGVAAFVGLFWWLHPFLIDATSRVGW
jgi:uncharacterized membrane protein